MRVPRLHLVTDDAILARTDFLERAVEVALALAGAGAPEPDNPGTGRGGFGVALHLRGPGTPGRGLWELGRALRDPLRRAGVRLLVNDRADVARAVGADGLHLPGRGLPPTWSRSWLGPDALLGRSLAGPDEESGAGGDPGGVSHLDAGEVEALDYLMVGTLWRSPSHPGRAGAGPGRVREVARVLGGGERPLPLVGIGGLTPERVGKVLAAGGYGVAVRGGIWDSDDPPGAALAFATALSPARWEGRGEGGGGSGKGEP